MNKLKKQFKLWLDLRQTFIYDEKGQIGHDLMKETTTPLEIIYLQWLLENHFIPYLEFVKKKFYDNIITKRKTLSMQKIAEQMHISRSGLYRLLDKCKPDK